jgi:hypothetical protein
MPQKVTEFNGGVALTSIQDGDIAYLIRSGTDQFAEMETVREYMGGILSVEVLATAAQIEAAVNLATSIELLPDPTDASELIIPLQLLREVDGTYTDSNGAQVFYNGFAGAWSGLEMATLETILAYNTAVGTANMDGKRGKGLVLFFPFGAPTHTGGTGEVRFKLYYQKQKWGI